MFKSGANYNKLKTNFRLTINRLKLLEKKKTELAQKARKEIADYIVIGKEDRARIRVEHIIREDYLVEAMELLEMYCDLLLARFGMIQTQKELDPGLEEAIATIIWATPRLQTDVPELKMISLEFASKYGKEFQQACTANLLSNVNEKVMIKLGVQAPPKILVERYMIEIAKTYSVAFEPDPSVMQQDEIYAAENLLIDIQDDGKKPGSGGGGGGGGGMGVMQPAAASYPQTSPGKVPPPLPSSAPHGGAYPEMSPYPPGPAEYNSPYPPSQPNGAYGFHPNLGPMNKPPQDPAPSYNDLYNGQQPTNQGFRPPAGGVKLPTVPKIDDTFPELPSVPSNTLPNSVGTTSAGGEDVDFDDLTRRFEELKKKK